MTALHPRSSADPRMLRWITATALPAELPALDGLVADGVLERAEIGAGEIRTWLAEGRSWDDAGPLVRSTLFAALREVPECPELTTDQLTERIAELIRREVTPVAASHGGDITVESVRDGVLTVAMGGACNGCALGHKTLDDLVREAVAAHFPQIREVRAASPRRSWLTLGKRRP
ncbi:MAG: NifU family protein [Mycolicibacterium insubricum]|nr:NifU family protein [Mycobacterium sp.]